MAKDYEVPGLPPALGIAISVRNVQRYTPAGDTNAIIDNYICIAVRNAGKQPMRVTMTVEGCDPVTAEIRKTHTLRHGNWSEMAPGTTREKDIPPRALTWFLKSVEVERGGRIRRHELEHRIAHTEGKGCAAKVVVPSTLMILAGGLAEFWSG